jgi:cytochrome c peroxidase
MAIINPISQNNLFWDSRSKTLHDLSLQPVQNHIEMGMENLDRLVAKTRSD